jgi:EAL domain-containing protein (putative c-di-GMP-specific phosphodiesterase class I)
MHKFLVKVIQGNISPVLLSKKQVFDKILKHYQDSGKSFTITIEEQTKDLSTEQIRLYNAFFVKAADNYGCSFSEMESLLQRYMPIDQLTGNYLPKEKWSTTQLGNFINQATALLSEQGFNF